MLSESASLADEIIANDAPHVVRHILQFGQSLHKALVCQVLSVSEQDKRMRFKVLYANNTPHVIRHIQK